MGQNQTSPSETSTVVEKTDLPYNGDPLKGAQIYKEHCAGCHSIGPDMEHRGGPNLFDLWGREASTLPDFTFVDSDEKKGIIWNDKALLHYLDGIHIPGSHMQFRDLDGKDEDKLDLVAYLRKSTNPEAFSK